MVLFKNFCGFLLPVLSHDPRDGFERVADGKVFLSVDQAAEKHGVPQSLIYDLYATWAKEIFQDESDRKRPYDLAPLDKPRPVAEPKRRKRAKPFMRLAI